MNDHVRIVRLITRLNIGGPARQELLLHRALPQRGFDPHLVWGSVSPGEGEFVVPDTVAATHVPELRRELHPIGDLRAARTLSRLLRRQQPTIVDTHLAKARALGTFAARRAKIPILIHTFHGHVLEGYFSRAKTRAFLAAERLLARRAEVLVAVSSAVHDELLALDIGRPEQWRVIPLGLDLEDLLTRTIERDEARRGLDLAATGAIIGIVGRLTAIKNHALFLEVAARVAAERPDVTFVVAGDGELRPQLQSRARELLGDRCIFLGWVSDLPTLYQALDVVVLTSRNEGTPVALIEAAAASRPVVATDVGGVRDVVQDGKTGLLAKSGSADDVAIKVMKMLDDPELGAELGRAGREHVAGRFTIDRLADDLADLYNELLERKGISA